jgi:nucleotide-binding universal stress UspA family protein
VAFGEETIMTGFRRILCPVDLTSSSEAAVRQATALARWHHAELHALHVIPLLPELWAVPLSVGAAGLEPRITAGFRTELEKLFAPAREEGVLTSVELAEGDAGLEILRRADEKGNDLIVIGTHGRGGLERLLLGSVAEKVLRHARCPVLTVRDPAPSEPAHAPFHTVLCPTDFSATAQRAVEYATWLAEEGQADLVLLNVLEGPREMGHYDVLLEQHMEAQLKDAVSAEARDWCRVHETVRHGQPPQQILAVATEVHADLIVMGARGRSGLDRLLFGSTSNEVVRMAPCPLLTVGAATATARKPKELAEDKHAVMA